MRLDLLLTLATAHGTERPPTQGIHTGGKHGGRRSQQNAARHQVWMDTEGLFSSEDRSFSWILSVGLAAAVQDARSSYGPKIFSLALLFSSVPCPATKSAMGSGLNIVWTASCKLFLPMPHRDELPSRKCGSLTMYVWLMSWSACATQAVLLNNLKVLLSLSSVTFGSLHGRMMVAGAQPAILCFL